MKKNILILVGLIILVAIFFGAMYLTGFSVPGSSTNNSRDTKNFPKELPTPTIKITSYFLGGKVISIDGNTLKVNSQRVVVGVNGNYITNDEKNVTLASNVQVSLTSIVKGKYSKVPGKLSDIKVGSNVKMISTDDIAKMDSFTIKEIEVQKI